MSYESGLLEAKASYPFARWRAREADGLEQYTEENCNATKAIFDSLISELIGLGKNATEEDKLAKFKIAVELLNELNDEIGGVLIETEERDDLCGLINLVTEKSGIDPKKYGSGGEGPANLWRDW